MRYLEVVIRVKEENGEMVTETPLDTHRLEMLDLLSVPRQERIDQLEADTLEKGREIMCTIFLKQWELLDGVLASSHQHINQDCQAVFDGKTDLKIASRLGILHLGQQVCYCKSCQAHFLPLTQGLPEHQGMIITRGLQEWACLLPQGLPFATAARLLGWQTQEEQVISDTEVRSLVQKHGQAIRQAELAEVKALVEAQEDLSASSSPTWFPWKPLAAILPGRPNCRLRWRRPWRPLPPILPRESLGPIGNGCWPTSRRPGTPPSSRKRTKWPSWKKNL